MMLVQAKTLVIEAVKRVFDQEYPVEQFRDLWVSMEYPSDQANYPGIWVDFTPTSPLQVAGIGHQERVYDGDARPHDVTRWRFGGMITLTVVAMTSLERDLLADEMVRVLAFGRESAATSQFRASIETNDLIAMQLQWDRFTLSGKAETPGTPWGTDDVVYEISITIDCQGDFLSGFVGEPLVDFSRVEIYSNPENEAPPTIPDSEVTAGWV